MFSQYLHVIYIPIVNKILTCTFLNRLSRIARLLLFDLGSALVQNLSYRGSWYLITQKSLTGFSPFEDVSF